MAVANITDCGVQRQWFYKLFVPVRDLMFEKSKSLLLSWDRDVCVCVCVCRAGITGAKIKQSSGAHDLKQY